ncbi:hypothetical protein WJX77_009541 [Trebouxia sp. C0004]
MADQAAAASRPYVASHFDFVKQKPKHNAARLHVASIPKQANAGGTGPDLDPHSVITAPAVSRPVPVRLPDAPPLPNRRMPASAANNASSLVLSVQPGELQDQQQPVLSQRAPLSAGVEWKQATRTGSKPISIGDSPLLSRLAKLTSSSNSAVPPAAAAGSHIAGVLPAHGPKERDHAHSPSQQTQHGLIPILTAPRTELLSWPKSSAQSVRPSLQPASFETSHAQEGLSHSIRGPDTHPPAVNYNVAQPLFDGTTAFTAAEEPVWGAEVKPPAAAQSLATQHTQQPQPPCVSLSVLAAKPKSSSRSRLRLQKPPNSTGLTPVTMHSPHFGSNPSQAADTRTKSMPKSGNLASAEPQCQPQYQLDSLKAAARGCAVSNNKASLPSDHPVDQRGLVQQHDAEVAVEDQQASKGGFATPEVPWRSRTKPASAPDRAGSRMAPTSTTRRSAPRQMKRLYSGLSQEEVLGPELYETPEQVQVWQRRAQEEEEDSLLLVNYGRSMHTGRTQASLPGKVSHASQSGTSSGNVLAASRDLRAASGPVHPSHAQTSKPALLFDIADTQQPHGGTPLRIANEPAEEQVPSSGMLVDIADSSGPHQQQPRLTMQLDTAQCRSTQGHASGKAAHGQSADGLASYTVEARHNPSLALHSSEGHSHLLQHAVGQALLFDIDDDDADENQAETVQSSCEHQHQDSGMQKQPAKGLCCPPAAANGLLFDIDDDDDGDAAGQKHSNNNDSVAAAKPSGHHQHAKQSLSMPAAASVPAFNIADDKSDFCGGGAAAASSSRQHSDTDILQCMAAPAPVPFSSADGGDDLPQAPSAAQLQVRRASHFQASTSAAAVATVPTPISNSILGQSQQPTPATVARAASSQNIAPAQHQLQQQPQQKLQVLKKNRQSFKPPRRVSPPAAATGLAAEAARADAQAGRPLKRLRKAGQSGASLSSAAKSSFEYGHDEGEDDGLQHALWLSSHQPQNSALLTANQEADDCREEEQGLHTEGYEQHQGQGTRPKAASSGFNSARDLFLEQQVDKKEEIAEERANPFARLNIKSKQSLTEVPRSIQAGSRKSGVSAEALKAVLHPIPNADLWKRRLHGDSAEHSGTGTSTLAGSSSSAPPRRPAKHAQHSTAPGMFVSAASLKADSAFGQQRHESTTPGQRRVSQPGPDQHRAGWAVNGVERQVEGGKVIDLIGSPGKGAMQSSHRHAAETAGAIDEEEEEEGLLGDGPPWWERFPDFVPLSALKWGTNPRDGATVHINYEAQFTGQPAARGCKKASARDDLGHADADVAVLDVEDEEEQSSSKQSNSSRRRKHGSSSHDAREGGEGHTECRPGQWIYKNNHNVYIDANGRTLTGSRAYAKAQQDKGLSTKPSGQRARIRKTPGKVKRKRKSKAKGSKLPSFRATKSRFG